MAETAPIDTSLLQSGDMIDLEYQIVGTNETLIALAVHSIKQSIASDSRLDYQSGRREYRTDLETGTVYEFLIVTVIVRRYPRGEKEPDIQEAGLWVPIAVIVAAAAAAVIYYSGAVVYRSYTAHRSQLARIEEIERIRKDPNLSEAEKVAMLKAMGVEAAATGIGAGLSSFGGSLLAGVLIIGGLWALSQSGRTGGVD